jgi:hypothetical protein
MLNGPPRPTQTAAVSPVPACASPPTAGGEFMSNKSLKAHLPVLLLLLAVVYAAFGRTL